MPPDSTALPDLKADLIAARDAAIVCDLDAVAVVAIDGPDAAAFLQGQLSSDIAQLAVGDSQYSSCNSPGGRMLAAFTLWREGPEAFRALLPADIAEPIRKRLAMFVLRSKVAVADVTATCPCLGVGGPEATAAVRAALGAAPAAFHTAPGLGASVLGFPGPRYLVLAPPAAMPAIRAALAGVARPASSSAWQWLLVRGGLPEITRATQDKFVPQTANWDALGGISFQKGCYTGQEIIARTQYLGRLKERLYAFHAPDVAVTAGDRLYSSAFPDQACGTVVNAAPAPDGGVDLLAVLQLAAADSGDVRLGSADGPQLVPFALPYDVPAPTEQPRVAR
jgi:folate-binding protein YgfZ